MYLVFEYLTYLTLVALLGLALFTVAAGLLLSRAAAKMAASLARRATTHVSGFANKNASALSNLRQQRSHQEH
jgi:hypothetical protein